jgi:pentatricopeptide repeat protein
MMTAYAAAEAGHGGGIDAARNLLDGMLLRDVVSMMKVSDRLKIRNLVCWNAMIIGHCVYDEPGDGIQLFHEMRLDEVGTFGFIYADTSLSLHEFSSLTYLIPAFLGKNGSDDRWVLGPDEVTFVGILCACTRLGLLDAGKVYFEQMSTSTVSGQCLCVMIFITYDGPIADDSDDSDGGCLSVMHRSQLWSDN